MTMKVNRVLNMGGKSAGSVNYKYTLPLTAGRALAADAGAGIA
jgi:hypothetical protein